MSAASSMKLAMVHGPNDVRLDDVPMPVPGPNDVVVRVAVCGICGSDLGYARAGGLPLGAGEPLPLGHEFSGMIDSVGSAVTKYKSGQRVIVNPTSTANNIGVGGPGGFASHILVREAEEPGTLLIMPDGLSFENAALTEPLSVALHGVNRSGANSTSRVVVFGAGPIGLGVAAMLRLRGVADIVVVDRVDSRLGRAKAMGADAVFNPDSCDLWAEIGARHGRDNVYGQPVVNSDQFIEVSGAAPVVPAIIENCRFGAHLTIVAVHHEPVMVSFAMALAKELVITMAMAYPDEFGEVLGLLAGGRIDTRDYVSHTFPFSQFETAFEVAAQPEVAAKVLVTFP